MRNVTIQNLDQPLTSSLEAIYCDSFLCRLRGLTFRRTLRMDQGLLLVQGRDSRVDASIHMLGVFMDLAVIWINNAGQVVDTCLARRWRPAYVPKQPSRFILEINPHRLSDFKVGDRVRFEDQQTS
jgi:uncharacterized membrane protein (UPF0127 family)